MIEWLFFLLNNQMKAFTVNSSFLQPESNLRMFYLENNFFGRFWINPMKKQLSNKSSEARFHIIRDVAERAK